MNTKLAEYGLAERGEVVEPVIRVLEIGNLIFRDIRLLQDLILCEGRLFVIWVLFLKLFSLFFRWLVARSRIV